MTKRKILIATFASIVLVAGPAVVAAYVFRDPVNPGASTRIRQGMTEAEVRGVLGRACDIEEPVEYPLVLQEVDGKAIVGTSQYASKTWVGTSCEITVCFDEKIGRVCVVFLHENESVLQKLRRRLWPTDEEVGITLPAPLYLKHPPQHFPPAYSLQKELNSLEEAHRQSAESERP